MNAEPGATKLKRVNHSVTEPPPKTKTHHGGTETRRKTRRDKSKPTIENTEGTEKSSERDFTADPSVCTSEQVLQ